MKHYSDKEVFDKVLELFTKSNEKNRCIGYDNEGDFLTIEENTPDAVIIKIDAMYEAPTLDFEFLVDLSNFFDTTKINNLSDEWEDSGCDTCDYGSSYGYYIKISPQENK